MFIIRLIFIILKIIYSGEIQCLFQKQLLIFFKTSDILNMEKVEIGFEDILIKFNKFENTVTPFISFKIYKGKDVLGNRKNEVWIHYYSDGTLTQRVYDSETNSVIQKFTLNNITSSQKDFRYKILGALSLVLGEKNVDIHG